MPVDKIYHPAALVSAAAYYILGWFWYGTLFGRTLTGLTHATSATASAGDPVPYIVAAATSLVLAYVIALMLDRNEDRTAAQGAELGLFLSIGLVASTTLETSLFEGRPVTLWLINAGYVVVGLTMIGAIIGGWKKRSI